MSTIISTFSLIWAVVPLLYLIIFTWQILTNYQDRPVLYSSYWRQKVEPAQECGYSRLWLLEEEINIIQSYLPHMNLLCIFSYKRQCEKWQLSRCQENWYKLSRCLLLSPPLQTYTMEILVVLGKLIKILKVPENFLPWRDQILIPMKSTKPTMTNSWLLKNYIPYFHQF